MATFLLENSCCTGVARKDKTRTNKFGFFILLAPPVGFETYSFSARFEYFSSFVTSLLKYLKTASNPSSCFYSAARFIKTVAAPAPPTQKDPGRVFFFVLAPPVGFEPTTNRLHLIRKFLNGMDYIIIHGGCEALRFTM